MIQYDYLNVPLQILEFMISQNRVNEVKLWLYLKFQCRGGHVKLEDKGVECRCMIHLGIATKRTFVKRLKWLLRFGYITCNSKTKSYRLVSTTNIARKIDSTNYIGAILYQEDLDHLREFAFAALASNIIRRSLREKRRSGSILGRTRKRRYSSGSAYYQIPNLLFEKILKVSTSTVSRLKKEAKANKYISIKKVVYKIDLPTDQVNLLRKYGPCDPNRIVVIKNNIIYQEPDLISSNVFTRVNRQLKNLVRK